MKHTTALLLTAALGLASAQTAPATTVRTQTAQPQTASTQTASTVTDPALSKAAITIETGRYQGPLSSLLGAIAQAAGYELVLEVNVDNLTGEGNQARPVAYSFRDKPFNEVWPLLMDVYGLNYTVSELGGQPVIRVNNTAVQRVVDLKTAEASYVVERARVFFGSPVGQNQAQPQSQQPAQPQDQTAGGQTQYQFDSPTLRVIADGVTNRVIIRGNNQEVRDVEAFVRNLDASATAQREEQEARYGSNNASSNRREIYTTNRTASELLPFLQAQYPALRITAVPGGRSLMIDGESDTVTEAINLLTRVDPAPSADNTTQRVFQLVNANAVEIATTLSNTLARQLANASVNASSSSSTTTSNNSANAVGEAVRLAEREATIIPDARTNTLIVRGTPSQVAQIAALIPTLDQRVPQINLQVRIQEINETAVNSLGLNWSANIGGFRIANLGIGETTSGTTGGFTTTFNPLASSVGFNLFPALSALENQNVSKRIYSGSVAMQSGQRRLDASNGSRDASDMAAASVRSGGRLEITIPSGAGNIEKSIPYGVVLDFFDPVVAPDGTITVRVRGQITTVGNREALDAAITKGSVPYLLDFLNSEAQTKISFKPGETILLTGLGSSNDSETKQGIPGLSKVPGLGALAGRQSTNQNRTQMLFVITGDILQ